MTAKYAMPTYEADAFNCPHCGAYAHQKWGAVSIAEWSDDDLRISFCPRCSDYALWLNGKMLVPASSGAPPSADDMPPDVREDFEEAGKVVAASPRAAAALLRLALEKLMPHLGAKGKDLNQNIADLVKNGLPEKIQKALDAVRVTGNNAVHPGELDLRDSPETAAVLFGLLNMIVEVMITRPKQVDEIYGKLPESARDQITKRDGRTP